MWQKKKKKCYPPYIYSKQFISQSLLNSRTKWKWWPHLLWLTSLLLEVLDSKIKQEKRSREHTDCKDIWAWQLLWKNHHLHVISGKSGASLVAQEVKNLPAVRETWVRSLGRKDPLEKGMATYSSILVWRIPMDRRVWWATYSLWGNKESDMTEQLTLSQVEKVLERY